MFSYGRASVGRPTRTNQQRLCTDTGCRLEDLPGAMKDREEWKIKDRKIRAICVIWWWWWWWIGLVLLFSLMSCPPLWDIEYQILLDISLSLSLTQSVSQPTLSLSLSLSHSLSFTHTYTHTWFGCKESLVNNIFNQVKTNLVTHTHTHTHTHTEAWVGWLVRSFVS